MNHRHASRPLDDPKEQPHSCGFPLDEASVAPSPASTPVTHGQDVHATLLLFAAFLLATFAPNAGAAPVDLTPPKNSLGYADEQGYFRNVQRFGSIRFSDGFELPLRFEFWSGRLDDPAARSDFGWRGWHCGPLESVAEYYGGEKYLRLTLLCAKVLFLERSADDPTRYRSLDGSWTGLVDAAKKTIAVSRADGWRLEFRDRRIANLRTDTGMSIYWQRDPQGRLLAIREVGTPKDQAPALEVDWHDGDPASGYISALTLPKERYEFRFSGDGNAADRFLASVAWRDGALTRAVAFEQDRNGLQITGLDGSIRRFSWNPATGLLRSDGLNQYRILTAENRPDRIEMTTSTGEVLLRQIDAGKGTGRYRDENGDEIVVHRVTASGPTHNFIDKIDYLVAGRPVTVLKNHFDEKSGRLVARDWMGSPRWLEGFRGGALEPTLAPDPEINYRIEQYPAEAKAKGAGDAAAGAHAPTRIDYRFDDAGRHVGTEIGGQTVLSIAYASDGEYAAYEVPGRFRRERKIAADGGVETTLTIPGVTDQRFGYLDSPDPSVSERLIVRELRDPQNRPVERERLDGSTLLTEVLPKTGLPKHELLLAPDGKTRVREATYVYQPDGRKVLVIEESFQTGQLNYREVVLSSKGEVIDTAPLSQKAAAEWTNPQ